MKKTIKDYEEILIKAMDKHKRLKAEYEKIKSNFEYHVERINDYNDLERRYKLALTENRRLKQEIAKKGLDF